MKDSGPLLVGDGIENPGNALAMLHAAEIYRVGCCFRDTHGLEASGELRPALAEGFPAILEREIQEAHSQIIAFENLPGAAEVYGFPTGPAPAILVGNERRGLSQSFRHLASDAVQVPMLSRRINCLNVAAASAVALHYLCHAQVHPMVTRRHPANRRPELLLIGGGNHIELGSAIRSAAAFGWDRAFIEDREGIWFGCDRVKRSEGRAAARRGRNVIRLIPCPSEAKHSFPEVTVIRTSGGDVPVHRARLDRGRQQLVVIPDERGMVIDREPWERFGRKVQFASLGLDVSKNAYHYRFAATVALAEIARQVGRPAPGIREPRRRGPLYDRALELASQRSGQEVTLDQLTDY